MAKVFLKTYGCQMNERDSEAVAAQLLSRGYALTESESDADVVLLNTCSVRDAAELKAVGKMKFLAADFRKQKRKVVLGFMGCMAQARGRGLLEEMPQVNLVIGTQKSHKMADYLDAALAGKTLQVCDIAEEPGSQSMVREHLSVLPGGEARVSAFLSIMQGCNQRCTFCIVPQTRGMERSRTIEEIVAEARMLVSRGVKEITLLGQIVTSFGRREIPEKDGKSAFVQLIEAVHAIEGLERLRFTAPHPKGFGEDLIEAYGRLPKLCPSAHIPIQSGSDRILKLMHRGYTAERCLEIIGKLRRVQPGLGLTTDIIVGFPGETGEDFEQTLAFVKAAEFDNGYLFKYSPRQGTPAADMPGQISQEENESRHAQLLNLVNEIAARRYRALVGSKVQVLVEGPSKRNSARLTGRTRCNKIVIFEGSQGLQGQLLDLKVNRAGAFTLYGDPAPVNLKQTMSPLG